MDLGVTARPAAGPCPDLSTSPPRLMEMERFRDSITPSLTRLTPESCRQQVFVSAKIGPGC